MDVARFLGIILACLGSVGILIALVMKYMLIPILDLNMTLYFTIDMIAWAGAFTMKGRRFGGVLVLLMGVILIIFCVLYTSDPSGYALLTPISLFSSLFTIPYVTIEALLMIGGGLIITASGTD